MLVSEGTELSRPVFGGVWLGQCALSITLLLFQLLQGHSAYYYTFVYGLCPVAFIIINVGLAGFQANIIQFGIDQMVDASGDQMSAFIHCQNPFKIVYSVIKFASKHNRPIYRSALTYWDDTPPSRLDLGKNKYGGPFSTEEVENVKSFFAITAVLLSLGLYIIADYTVSAPVPSLLVTVIPLALGTVADLIVYIAALEFICAQSPYNFRGMLFGTFYAIQGLFTTIAMLIAVAVAYGYKQYDGTYGCGNAYYPAMLGIASVGFILYVVVGRSPANSSAFHTSSGTSLAQSGVTVSGRQQPDMAFSMADTSSA
eukprot:Em0013g640a